MNGFEDVALLLLIAVPLFGSISMMFMPGGDSEETWYFAIFIAVSLASDPPVVAQARSRSPGVI